jgi:hypothetical protein
VSGDESDVRGRGKTGKPRRSDRIGEGGDAVNRLCGLYRRRVCVEAARRWLLFRHRGGERSQRRGSLFVGNLRLAKRSSGV